MRRSPFALIAVLACFVVGGHAILAQQPQRPSDRFVDEASPTSRRYRLPDRGIWSWVVARCPECQGLAEQINTLKRQRADLLLEREALAAEETPLRQQLDTDSEAFQQAQRQGDQAVMAQLRRRIDATIARRVEIAEALAKNTTQSSSLFDQQQRQEALLRDCEQRCVASQAPAAPRLASTGQPQSPDFPITPIPNSPGARCSACQAAADMHAGAERAFHAALEYRDGLWVRVLQFDVQIDALSMEHARLTAQLAAGDASVRETIAKLEQSWKSLGAQIADLHRQVEAFEPKLNALVHQAETFRREFEDCNRKCATPTTTGGPTGGATGTSGAGRPSTPSCSDCPRIRERIRTLEEDLQKLAHRIDIIQASQEELEEARPRLNGERLQNVETQLRMLDNAHQKAVAEEQQKGKELESLQEQLRNCDQKCSTNSTSNTKWYLIGGGGALAAVIAGSGGGESTPVPAATQSTTPVTTPTPPITTPTPPTTTPTPPATAGGNYRCIACLIRTDVSNHNPTLRVCDGLTGTFTVAEGSLTIRHPAPFIEVGGANYNTTSGAFDISGTGSVAGFNNVAARAVGTVTNSSGRIVFDYTLGANGVFPGGQPITYSVTLQKQ